MPDSTNIRQGRLNGVAMSSRHTYGTIRRIVVANVTNPVPSTQTNSMEKISVSGG
jgi:hypothetical protein